MVNIFNKSINGTARAGAMMNYDGDLACGIVHLVSITSPLPACVNWYVPSRKGTSPASSAPPELLIRLWLPPSHYHVTRQPHIIRLCQTLQKKASESTLSPQILVLHDSVHCLDQGILTGMCVMDESIRLKFIYAGGHHPACKMPIR